ncbi:hypothetical protein JCM11251_001523 [Rhodosporidiobolus azoricus]
MAGIANKVKQVFSHEDHTTSSTPNSNSAGIGSTPTHTSAGDRAAVTEVPTGDRSAAGADRTGTHSTTGLTDSKATHTGSTGVGHESKAERAVEHIREHAEPPAHHHNQPQTDGLVSEREAAKATHDHQHLAPVTHETRHHHEVEEVERQREIDRHVHHVQHHVQPVLDTQHSAEQHHQKNVPTTEIRENHVATNEDKAQFAALNREHDSVQEAAREKTIIDKGEQVRVNKHDHVHHVVQPIIERDVHTHDRQHTTVPIHQETHEAPIVHQSQQHAPLRMDEFVKGGGDLNSGLKHSADLLDVTGKECERTVDGPAETLVSNLGLSSGQTATTGTGVTPTSSTTGAAGTTGGAL